MTSEARSLIDELDAVLSKASESQHLAILRRVTELFLDGSKSFTDQHVAVFDEVIGRLIEKTAHPALIRLSANLAAVGKAPVNVVVSLASEDDIAVSGPVLENSSALSDQALVEIAGKKGQKHLAAIAGRSQICESVTDILVDRGNSEVARKVTANQGSRFSELGFVKLIGRANGDKDLAGAIASRVDLPPELEPFLKLALA